MNTFEFHVPDEPWIGKALCAQVGGDLWHPEKANKAWEAKKVCALCEVRVECLDYAMTHGEWGVWGGLSDRERRALKRSKGRAA